MDIRTRAETFSRYVGLELKGKITTQGFTAKSVAEAIGRQPAAFNRWLNGKVEMPMTVFCEACEYIDVEPSKLVEDAYARLSVEHGERDGRVYLHPDFDILVKRGDGVIGKPDAIATVTPLRTAPVGGSDENVIPDQARAALLEDGDDGAENHD